MSDFGVETPQERRDRYLRLARAAADAAEKTPMSAAKEMYFKLAQSWAAMAEEHEPEGLVSLESYEPESAGDIARPSPRLNVKLNQPQ